MPPVAHAAAAGVPARRRRAAVATAARTEDATAARRRRGGVGQTPGRRCRLTTETGGPLAGPGTTPVPLPTQRAPSCPQGGAAALAESVGFSDTVDADVRRTKNHDQPRETSAAGVSHSVQGAQPNGADLPRGLLSAGLSFERMCSIPASTSRAMGPARVVSAETLPPRGVDAHTVPNAAAATPPAGGTTDAAGRFLGHCQPVLVPPLKLGAGLARSDETRMELECQQSTKQHQVSFLDPFAKVRLFLLLVTHAPNYPKPKLN